MSYIPKRKWPLREVLDRHQDFRSSAEHPKGFIAERLSCGHVYRDDIATHATPHRSDVRRRRCIDCAKEGG